MNKKPEKINVEDITLKQFRPFYNLRSDGDINDMFLHLELEAMESKVQMSTICDKWAQYVEMCDKEERDSQYIKKFKNFLDEKMYNGEFTFENKPGKIAKIWLEGLQE